MGVTAIRAEFKLYGVIKRKGGWYIARCPLLDLTTQGRSEEEARHNLCEASELFLTSCLERGTLDQALRELGFVRVEKSPGRLPAHSFEMVIPLPLRFRNAEPCLA